MASFQNKHFYIYIKKTRLLIFEPNVKNTFCTTLGIVKNYTFLFKVHFNILLQDSLYSYKTV